MKTAVPAVTVAPEDETRAAMTKNLERLTPVTPTPKEVAEAQEASRQLQDLLAGAARKAKGRPAGRGTAYAVRLEASREPSGAAPQTIPLPASVVRLLGSILGEMAHGKAVAVLPCGRELSTEEAAQLLNVSRPFVAKLVDEGKLPARKVGRHRRIRLEDLMAYKRRDDEVREQALAELAAMSQELDLGY
jgi:excisionase family DNA binding protein